MLSYLYMANYTKRNKEYMRLIAAKGGKKTAKIYGIKHFSKIGKKGYKAMIDKLSTFTKSIA